MKQNGEQPLNEAELSLARKRRHFSEIIQRFNDLYDVYGPNGHKEMSHKEIQEFDRLTTLLNASSHLLTPGKRQKLARKHKKLHNYIGANTFRLGESPSESTSQTRRIGR